MMIFTIESMFKEAQRLCNSDRVFVHKLHHEDSEPRRKLPAIFQNAFLFRGSQDCAHARQDLYMALAQCIEYVRLDNTKGHNSKSYTILLFECAEGYCVYRSWGKITAESHGTTFLDTYTTYDEALSLLKKVKTQKMDKGYEIRYTVVDSTYTPFIPLNIDVLNEMQGEWDIL